MANMRKRIDSLMTLGKINTLSNSDPIIENIKNPNKNVEQDETYEEARIFFHQNLFANFVCMLSGLYCIMFIPSIVKVLHHTRKSDDPKKAFKR